MRASRVLALLLVGVCIAWGLLFARHYGGAPSSKPLLLREAPPAPVPDLPRGHEKLTA